MRTKKILRWAVTLSTVIYDMLAVSVAFFIALIFQYGSFAELKQNAMGAVYFDRFCISIPILVIIFIVALWAFRMYRTIWRFAGSHELVSVFLASFLATVFYYLTGVVLSLVFPQFSVDNPLRWLSLRCFVMGFFVTVVLVAFERFSVMFLARYVSEKGGKSVIHGKIMVIGAGTAGYLLIRDICTSRYMRDGKVVCLIDDAPEKQGQYILNVKVCGTRYDIIELAKKYSIDTIIFAIPTCSGEDKSEILSLCQKTGCKLKTLPAIHQLVSGDVKLSSVRSVEIEDLLGRDPIRINLESVMSYVENRVVMVTGGGGSIGSELCRQLAAHHPKQLIVFEMYENNAYDIQNELKRNYPELDLVTLIGSVRDTKRIETVFETYRPEIVYHAAAHKHVPLMEDSPNESVKNNVFGTLKTVRAADKFGTKRFVLISTDKAVNPTNIMGASKRICEMIVQTYNRRSNTEFVAVRFGNVLGSNGSVIPLFKKQIEAGGPVTVTDPNIIRYFMTIPEAVSLVLQAGATAKGGEIFVLDMGKPVKILDLAENLIKLSGYVPYEDIKIVFSGLRPGEKLYEELLMDEEGLTDTENALIHIGKPIELDEDKFLKELDELYEIMYDENVDIRARISEMVPTYKYSK